MDAHLKIKAYICVGYIIDSSEDNAMFAFGAEDSDTFKLFCVSRVVCGQRVGSH